MRSTARPFAETDDASRGGAADEVIAVVSGDPADAPSFAEDAALAHRLQGGDPAAAVELFDRFAPRVRALLRRMLGSQAEVDDLTQEVFVRVFRRVSDLREPRSLRFFIMGVAVRVARAELGVRWVRRWMQLSPTGTLPDVGGLPTDHDAREALKRLEVILDRLSTETRALFVLRYVEGLEVEDVATTMGLPLGTTKRKLGRTSRRVFGMIQRDVTLAAYLGRRKEKP